MNEASVWDKCCSLYLSNSIHFSRSTPVSKKVVTVSLFLKPFPLAHSYMML